MHRHESSPRSVKQRLRRFVPLAGVAAVLGLTACTPGQIANWTEWNNNDPAAAQEFANRPEIQAAMQPQVEAAHSNNNGGGGGGCDGIYNEMLRQGASTGVAQRFAYHIAPRESGCSPQFVHDRDDWSYSRFGLNGLTAGLRSNWASWCGADVRSDTKNLSTDVNCALAAYSRMGWAPWG